jgi:hypothetical protein
MYDVPEADANLNEDLASPEAATIAAIEFELSHAAQEAIMAATHKYRMRGVPFSVTLARLGAALTSGRWLAVAPTPPQLTDASSFGLLPASGLSSIAHPHSFSTSTRSDA